MYDQKIEVIVLETIFAMEPVSSDAIPHGDDWIAQVKWDGVRILTYAEHHEVRLFNRRKNERTLHYPEILNIREYCSSQLRICMIVLKKIPFTDF